MSNCTGVLPKLSNLDASRLPLGVLEQYTLSPDRRALVNPSKKPVDEEEKKEDKKASQKSISPFTEGSDDHVYYSMLTIQKESEKRLLVEDKREREDGLKRLNAEMEKWIDTIETS